MVRKLAKLHKSPKDAEIALTSQNENVPPSTGDQGAIKLSQRSVYSPLPVQHCTPPSSLSSIDIEKEDTIMGSFRCLPCDEQLVVASDMVSYVSSKSFGLDIPDDFLRLALTGMHKLASEGRSNVIYGLCKGFGTSRPDKPDECYFPVSRMPMGLLEYMVNFFISEFGNQIDVCICCDTYLSLLFCVDRFC